MKPLLTSDEVAGVLKVKTRTVMEWLRAESQKGVKAGRVPAILRVQEPMTNTGQLRTLPVPSCDFTPLWAVPGAAVPAMWTSSDRRS